MDGKSDNNKVMLEGKIVAPFKFQMEHKGEAFYRTILQVNRQSGQCAVSYTHLTLPTICSV